TLQLRQLLVANDEVATADVNIVLQHQGNRLAGFRSLKRFGKTIDGFDHTFLTRRQHGHLVAYGETTAAHTTRISTVVVILGCPRPNDVWYGKAGGKLRFSLMHVHGFEDVEQRTAGVPGHLLRLLRDVFSIQRADGEKEDFLG